MKNYEIYDFGRGSYLGQDQYYTVSAGSPAEAIKKYMNENGLSGKIVRTITDTNTRFIVHNSRGSYLYSLEA